jgi:hypothetical protein
MSDLPPNAVHPLSRVEWREWLAQHHASNKGVWLVGYKKSTNKPRFDYDEAVEEALVSAGSTVSQTSSTTSAACFGSHHAKHARAGRSQTKNVLNE